MAPGGTETIRQRIDSFAAARATTARTLKAADRKELIIKLRKEGLLNFRKSINTLAQHPGVSRATAYLYVRQPD
ncbi:TPA: helix-turn-helix domain-containing protein [Salmonella enterica]